MACPWPLPCEFSLLGCGEHAEGDTTISFSALASLREVRSDYTKVLNQVWKGTVLPLAWAQWSVPG